MRFTGLENASGQTVEAILENGSTGSSTEGEYKSLQMARCMKGSTLKIESMAMESTLGLMGGNTMVNG